MDDIVEKVARAMALVEFPDLSGMSDADEYETVRLYAEEAQAALAAIREEYAIVPRHLTEAMYIAAEAEMPNPNCIGLAYPAMIEAGEVR